MGPTAMLPMHQQSMQQPMHMPMLQHATFAAAPAMGPVNQGQPQGPYAARKRASRTTNKPAKTAAATGAASSHASAHGAAAPMSAAMELAVIEVEEQRTLVQLAELRVRKLRLQEAIGGGLAAAAGVLPAPGAPDTASAPTPLVQKTPAAASTRGAATGAVAGTSTKHAGKAPPAKATPAESGGVDQPDSATSNPAEHKKPNRVQRQVAAAMATKLDPLTNGLAAMQAQMELLIQSLAPAGLAPATYPKEDDGGGSSVGDAAVEDGEVGATAEAVAEAEAAALKAAEAAKEQTAAAEAAQAVAKAAQEQAAAAKVAQAAAEAAALKTAEAVRKKAAAATQGGKPNGGGIISGHQREQERQRQLRLAQLAAGGAAGKEPVPGDYKAALNSPAKPSHPSPLMPLSDSEKTRLVTLQTKRDGGHTLEKSEVTGLANLEARAAVAPDANPSPDGRGGGV